MAETLKVNNSLTQLDLGCNSEIVIREEKPGMKCQE